MIIKSKKIKDLIFVNNKSFKDKRGFFKELLKEKDLKKKFPFLVMSFSKKNVIRGLHLQTKNSQGKFITVIKGKIFDVAVDLRKNSKTFGKYESFELEENDGLQLYLPPGMAHGFVALDEINELRYRSTEYYNPEDEAGLFWNDVNVGIDWGVNKSDLIINDRDMNFPVLKAITRDKLPKLFQNTSN